MRNCHTIGSMYSRGPVQGDRVYYEAELMCTEKDSGQIVLCACLKLSLILLWKYFPH